MFSNEIRGHESFGSLLAQAVRRMTGALLGVLSAVAKRQSDRAERWTALALLGSVAMLGTGVTIVAPASAPLAVVLGLFGAIGMLASGYAGTRLDGGKAGHGE